jgi:hypothetical protein
MVPHPTRPYRALRAVVGAVVIATTVGLWAHGKVVGSELGTLWDVVVIALLIASGIAVFGRDTMTTGLEEAKDVSGQSDTEDSDGDA